MRILSIKQDHRRFPERRVLDEGPPPGRQERRIHAERRGFEVVELNFDERIVLGRFGKLPG
jgi:hypothetical protein